MLKLLRLKISSCFNASRARQRAEGEGGVQRTKSVEGDATALKRHSMAPRPAELAESAVPPSAPGKRTDFAAAAPGAAIANQKAGEANNTEHEAGTSPSLRSLRGRYNARGLSRSLDQTRPPPVQRDHSAAALAAGGTVGGTPGSSASLYCSLAAAAYSHDSPRLVHSGANAYGPPFDISCRITTAAAGGCKALQQRVTLDGSPTYVHGMSVRHSHLFQPRTSTELSAGGSTAANDSSASQRSSRRSSVTPSGVLVPTGPPATGLETMSKLLLLATKGRPLAEAMAERRAMIKYLQGAPRACGAPGPLGPGAAAAAQQRNQRHVCDWPRGCSPGSAHTGGQDHLKRSA